MTYQRRLSSLEILAAAGGCTLDDSSQKINQFVIEGKGGFDETALQAVLNRLAESMPDSTVVLKGFWGFKKWRSSGKAPRLNVVNSNWDGRSNKGAEFLDGPMDVWKGPTTEITLVKGETTRLVVRIHHAVMDGMGTHTYVENIFKGLRGEDIDCCKDDIIAEDIISDVECDHKDEIIPSTLTVLEGDVDESVPLDRDWHRFTIEKHDFRLLPKIIHALAAIAREQGEGPVRINIPVDMRRHVKDLVATANLSGVLIVDVGEEDTMRSIAKSFNRKLTKNHEVANFNPGLLKVAPWIPFPMAKNMTQNAAKTQVSSKDVLLTAYISVMNHCDLRIFSTPEFEATTAYFLPLHTYTAPMFMTMWSNDNGAELCVGAPTTRCSNGRLEVLVDKLRSYLT